MSAMVNKIALVTGLTGQVILSRNKGDVKDNFLSKIFEKILIKFTKWYDLPFSIIYFYNVYGDREL
jgi:hypothetical protein